MAGFSDRAFSVFLSALLLFSAQASPGMAATTPPAQQATTEPVDAPPGASADLTGTDAASGWPRQFSSGGRQITIYQPQVESWQNNQIQERAAVSIQMKGAAEPTFGVIWINARTEVDKSTNLVSLEDIKISRVNFPSKPSQQGEYQKLFQKEAPAALRPVSLERLQASLSVTRAEEKTSSKAPELKNTPPKVIYSNQPAALVLIDGEPVLRETGVENILRVVNTSALILFDRVHGKAYLYLGDRWMESGSEQGPFGPAKDIQPSVLSALNQAKDEAASQKLVDLMNDPESGVMQALKKGIVPKVYVSTTPASLIQTRGTPQFEPVAQTRLLYVKNSSDNLFLDTADQKYYVLLSGRWYRASSLDSPTWDYVDQKALPADFAKIPESHPSGDVLASVAGTPQAKEATISNEIPQTATIERDNTQAAPDITYDGGPQFQPIQGTPLQYAVNSPVPVIEVDPHTFYSVQNGVWFVATGPTGPWVVATQVPAVIYSIPPSSPLYYVTYVYIYGYTPRYVYTGYLPGYLGSYVTPDGVVVYGTGYYYTPWIGTVWYGPPVTFGFGVTWGLGFGWTFPVGLYAGFFIGPCLYPWWGPWHYAWYHGWGWGGPWYGYGPHHGPYSGYGTRGFGPGHGPVAVNLNRANIYHSWSSAVVRSTYQRGAPIDRVAPVTGRTGSVGGRYGAGISPTRPTNNVYADHPGNVYRYTGKGWQRYGSSGWARTSRPPNVSNNVGRTAPNAGAPSGQTYAGGGYHGSMAGSIPQQELEQERMARQAGEQRAQGNGGSAYPGYSGGQSGSEHFGGYPGSFGGGGRSGGFGGGGHSVAHGR